MRKEIEAEVSKVVFTIYDRSIIIYSDEEDGTHTAVQRKMSAASLITMLPWLFQLKVIGDEGEYIPESDRVRIILRRDSLEIESKRKSQRNGSVQYYGDYSSLMDGIIENIKIIKAENGQNK